VTVLLLVGCLRARIDALVADVAGLEREIAATEEVVAHMKVRLDRARNHLVPVRTPGNEPKDFDPLAPIPRGDSGRPDVILLSIDTLRADHLGAYGYGVPTSPFIDQLASEGTRFADAWSPSPWTLPSHTTMLSGQLPIHHGTIEDDLHIRDDLPLVQESFQEAGYQTFGIVATLYVSSKYGFDRGFDGFHDFGVLTKELNNLSTVGADQVFRHALQRLQKSQRGKPVFAFLHVYDPHYSYNAPIPWNEKFDRKPVVGDAI
jgi:arylsulfatase A-like enzyme